jgi:PGF-CTERM protein
MKSRVFPVLVGFLLVVSLVPSAMAAGYEISASDTTSIPERTVEVEGSSFTIDSMVRVSPGATVSVDVSAPDEAYDVYIYNSEEQVVDTARGEGDDSFSFTFSGYEPGSYAITTYNDGYYEAVQPVLVSGYDVSVDAPSSVSSGESFDVALDVTATAADTSPDNVNVIVAQGGTTHEVDATENGGEYTATIAGDELNEGDYTVYGVVQGADQAFGQQELLGLSNGQSLTVESDSGNDGSNSNPDSRDGSESTATEADSPVTTTDSTDSNATNSSDGVPTDTETGTSTEPPTTTSTKTVTETATPTETDNGVITPGEETMTESTDSNGPGFTVVGTVVALATIALFGRWWT